MPMKKMRDVENDVNSDGDGDDDGNVNNKSRLGIVAAAFTLRLQMQPLGIDTPTCLVINKQ